MESLSNLRVIRLVFAAICIAVLVVSQTSFDALGADCGDAPTAGGGGDAFTCNTAAYVLMAAAMLATLGLVGTIAWAIVDAVRGSADKRARRDG